MISHYLLEVSLNHVTLSIFEEEISSRFRKYQVQIEYVVTNNEIEAFLDPSHVFRNKEDAANFDLKKPNFCHLSKLYFSFHLLGGIAFYFSLITQGIIKTWQDLFPARGDCHKEFCSSQGCGSGSWKRKRWKRSFFCGSGSAKILPLPLPHRLFDFKSNLAKKFCPFPNLD